MNHNNRILELESVFKSHSLTWWKMNVFGRLSVVCTKITTSVSFGYHRLTLITAWIRNHMPNKVLGEITYPFQTSPVAALKFGNGSVISTHIFYTWNNLYMKGLTLNHVIKGSPGQHSLRCWWIGTLGMMILCNQSETIWLSKRKVKMCSRFGDQSVFVVWIHQSRGVFCEDLEENCEDLEENWPRYNATV